MSIADRPLSPVEEAAEGHGFARPNRTDAPPMTDTTPWDAEQAVETAEASRRKVRDLFELALAGEHQAQRTGGTFYLGIDRVMAFLRCPRSEAVDICDRVLRAIAESEAAIEVALAAPDRDAALARALPSAVGDLRPGLEEALRRLRHPNAGMEPPDGGSPSETDRVRNVAEEIEEVLATLASGAQAGAAGGRSAVFERYFSVHGSTLADRREAERYLGYILDGPGSVSGAAPADGLPGVEEIAEAVYEVDGIRPGGLSWFELRDSAETSDYHRHARSVVLEHALAIHARLSAAGTGDAVAPTDPGARPEAPPRVPARVADDLAYRSEVDAALADRHGSSIDGAPARSTTADEEEIPGHPSDRYPDPWKAPGRWELGIRNIVTILHGARYPFEIRDIVEDVRALAKRVEPKTEITAADGLREALEPIRAYVDRCHITRWLSGRADEERLLVAWSDTGPADPVTITMGHLRRLAALNAAPSADRGEAGFQARNRAWMDEVFAGDPTDLAERVHRFTEEALELGQAFGQTRDEVSQIADYVHGRPKGDPEQEVGGTKTTLALLCTFAGIDMDAAGEAELARCSTPEIRAKIREKRSKRHGRGPLPGTYAPDFTPRQEPTP